MSKLIIATNNQGKVDEIKEILAGVYDCVVSLKDEGIVIDVEEDGKTFYENALKKAIEVSCLTDCDVLADDSGLCVDGLNGQPGVYSARYAGEKASDMQNIEKLLANVRGLAEQSRSAKFVACIVVANGGREKFSAEGECCGQIIDELRGENGFGYDPVFYVPELNKTFAQIDAQTKNEISHRARALKRIAEEIRQSGK